MDLRLFFATLVFTFLFISCKKYQDGGKHSFAAHRLVKNWTITKFTINSTDSLTMLNPIFTRSSAIKIINKHKSHQFPGTVNTFLQISDSIVSGFNGNISFYDSKDQLQFTNNFISYHKNVYPFWIDRSQWQIIELTNSKVELKLDDFENGKSYSIVLE